MSHTRSLLAAAGLTALIIAAVLVVGARQGAFTHGSDAAVAALPAEAPAVVQDTAIRATDADPVQQRHRDDVGEDEHGPPRRGEHEARSGSRTLDRAHGDDD